MTAPNSSSVRGCSAEGCPSPHFATGLCNRHYQRERNRIRPHRSDQRLRVRARHRAVARLVAAHREEFTGLHAEELLLAEAEAQQLAAALDAPAEDEPPVRLLPGPRPKDEPDVTRRIRECAQHHDAGHVCASCGSRPSARKRIEDLLRVGKSVQWITANTGEPAALVREVLAELQQSAAS